MVRQERYQKYKNLGGFYSLFYICVLFLAFIYMKY